jgi:hypothetical protein
MTGFDVIGDIHGSARKLEGLLQVLGYEVVAGAHRHESRQAVFVGDLMDRGDTQVEVVRMVRAMHEAGSALVVMGNHEFNAISWATPDPQVPGDFARSHRGRRGEHNREQHKAYLDQVVEGSALHREHIGWFRTLPLYLDLEGIRVAHACWHPASFAVLDAWVPPGTPLSDEFIMEANTRGTDAFDAVEVVLKGPEVKLPAELAWRDPEQTVRHSARLRWWDDAATTMRAMAMIPLGSESPDGSLHPGLPDLPSDEADAYRYTDPVPVFFGHYWFHGTPAPAAAHAACVDYSAVRPGCPLVAYRWDGTGPLNADDFLVYGGGPGST